MVRLQLADRVYPAAYASTPPGHMGLHGGKRLPIMIEIKGRGACLWLVATAPGPSEDRTDWAREMAGLPERLAQLAGFWAGGDVIVEIRGAGSIGAEFLQQLAACLLPHPELRLRQIVVAGGAGTQREAATAGESGSSEVVEFHWGTVRGGQVLKSNNTLVVLGSVNPGGVVRAAGDIYVAGALRGLAHAGVRGDEARLIYAMDMAPVQLRIAGHVAVSPPGYRPGRPQYARVEDGSIKVGPAGEGPGGKAGAGADVDG